MILPNCVQSRWTFWQNPKMRIFSSKPRLLLTKPRIWEGRKRNALQLRDVKTNQVDKRIRKKGNPTWWVMSCNFLSCDEEYRCNGHTAWKSTYVFVRSIKRSCIDYECRDPVLILCRSWMYRCQLWKVRGRIGRCEFCTLRSNWKKYCLCFGLSTHAHYLWQHRGAHRLVSQILIRIQRWFALTS